MIACRMREYRGRVHAAKLERALTLELPRSLLHGDRHRCGQAHRDDRAGAEARFARLLRGGHGRAGAGAGRRANRRALLAAEDGADDRAAGGARADPRARLAADVVAFAEQRVGGDRLRVARRRARSVWKRISMRPRSLKRPPFSTRVTAPRTRDPAGITVVPSTFTSRVTRASTRSSSCAVSLETVCSSSRPMTESAGMVNVSLIDTLRGLRLGDRLDGCGRRGLGGGRVARATAPRRREPVRRLRAGRPVPAARALPSRPEPSASRRRRRACDPSRASRRVRPRGRRAATARRAPRPRSAWRSWRSRRAPGSSPSGEAWTAWPARAPASPGRAGPRPPAARPSGGSGRHNHRRPRRPRTCRQWPGRPAACAPRGGSSAPATG